MSGVTTTTSKCKIVANGYGIDGKIRIASESITTRPVTSHVRTRKKRNVRALRYGNASPTDKSGTSVAAGPVSGTRITLTTLQTNMPRLTVRIARLVLL